MGEAISVEGLSKRYWLRRRNQPTNPLFAFPFLRRRSTRGGRPNNTPRELWALRDVSFSVKAGTIVGVIGPNGAGKTTLLKIVGRITLPTKGLVSGRGRVVSLLEVGTGFQTELTGRENLLLQAALYGIEKSYVEARFKDIVDFADLGEFIDVPVRRYSSGMYLRLAFSAAINMQPNILLADEVLAVGDLAFQERCLQRVEAAGAEGLTVLFVSHDMSAVRRLCQRVLWLQRGQLIEDGPTEEVVGHYEATAHESPTSTLRAHRNPSIELLRTSLRSEDGEELGAVRASQATYLTAAIRVVKPHINVRGAFALSVGRQLAFRSVQPQPMTLERPGLYLLSARIPEHLLADALYRVKTGLMLEQDGEHDLLVDDDALSFRVYHTEPGLPIWGTYLTSAGVVAPQLIWEITKAPQP